MFSIYLIDGGKALKGEVIIKGAKNSILALIPASLLTKGTIVLSNACKITDVGKALNIMVSLNANCIWDEDIIINTKNDILSVVGSEAKEYRGSYYFMGALLALNNHVEISYPGGCYIGRRPIDIHLRCFKEMGASIMMEDEKIVIDGPLTGQVLDVKKSVGATINVLLAGVTAKGKTIINNYAKEPEVLDVISFLKKIGYDITVSDSLVINGKKIVSVNIKHQVIPDRIEALTYIVMGLMLGEITIKNAELSHIKGIIDLLINHNADIIINDNDIVIKKSRMLPFNICISEYPGIPTDIQQILVTMCSLIRGKSMITETIFENRFLNCIELNKMGANISIDKNMVIIHGVDEFSPANVIGTDLRGTMSLVIAALVAKGTSIVENNYHVERGYDNFLGKIRALGAEIEKQ